MSRDFSNQYCVAENAGRDVDFEGLSQHLLGNHRAARYRDVLKLDFSQAEAYVFRYGLVVFWGADSQVQDEVRSLIEPYLSRNASGAERETYVFTVGEDKARIHTDHIYLPDDEFMSRLAVSHALAQSLQLNEFEKTVQQTIQQQRYIPLKLSTQGKIGMPRTKLARLRGELFLVKSDIMLHYDLLDEPEFFWDYPELANLYEMAARYLDIKARVEVLSKKLETISELLEMLADEQKHQHSSTLEWIIIWLIALEIILFAVQDFLLG